MTKEELKQEAKEYADKYGKSNFDIWDTARFAYYQSAEPREKRIAELEKELAITDHDREHNYYECLDLYKKVEELEKENKVLTQNLEDTEIVNKDLEKKNAELRKKKLAAQDAVTMQMYTNKANKEIANRKLTKAKELLKNLLSAYTTYADSFDDRDNEIVEEAVQFLDSEAKK